MLRLILFKIILCGEQSRSVGTLMRELVSVSSWMKL